MIIFQLISYSSTTGQTAVKEAGNTTTDVIEVRESLAPSWGMGEVVVKVEEAEMLVAVVHNRDCDMVVSVGGGGEGGGERCWR